MFSAQRIHYENQIRALVLSSVTLPSNVPTLSIKILRTCLAKTDTFVLTNGSKIQSFSVHVMKGDQGIVHEGTA